MQRRYHMQQRPPLLFWLLLAATLSVDALVFSWRANPLGYFYGAATRDALLVSQLSVVCIWSVLHPHKDFWTKISPLIAVVLASLVVGVFGLSQGFGRDLRILIGGSFTHYGVHAALLVVVLWLFARTAYWRRRAGVPAKWQFSMADVIVGITVVAVLAGAAHSFGAYFDWEDAVFILSSVALAAATAVVWSLNFHWLLRLSVAYGLTLLLGFVWWRPSLPDVEIFVAYYLIQSTVITIWLACGQILPTARSTLGAESEMQNQSPQEG